MVYEDLGLLPDDVLRVEGTPTLESDPWGILTALPRITIPPAMPTTVNFSLDPYIDEERFFYRVLKNAPIPTGSFLASQITRTEGTSGQVIPIDFSRPVYGPITYRVESAASGAISEGTLQLRGERSAILPLNVRADDGEATAPDVFTVSLVAENSSFSGSVDGPAPGLSTTLLVEDNDAVWVGLVQGASGPGLPLALDINRTGGTESAQLRPDGNAGVAGFLPEGEHPAASFELVKDARLHFVSVPIALPDASTPPFDGATQLIVTLTADVTNPGDTVDAHEIAGQATLQTTYADYHHLNRSSTGRFVLRRLQLPPDAQ